ncbi:hypothetical protein [Butyrivibrio sp. VCB2006]|uniref:hypothetical protein n=1 Tax=Butyrivibrio sp. VCB2006 TaxID=1280679 RepID=UPI000424EE55|nr:hypothetical protein [Butyrivibrio sp. VCB2006]
MKDSERKARRDSILEYIKKYPPYKNQADLGIDIRALCRYADEHGKAPADLTPEEVERFNTNITRE